MLGRSFCDAKAKSPKEVIANILFSLSNERIIPRTMIKIIPNASSTNFGYTAIKLFSALNFLKGLSLELNSGKRIL